MKDYLTILAEAEKHSVNIHKLNAQKTNLGKEIDELEKQLSDLTEQQNDLEEKAETEEGNFESFLSELPEGLEPDQVRDIAQNRVQQLIDADLLEKINVKPKRKQTKRRTKAQIEADKAQKAAASEASAPKAEDDANATQEPSSTPDNAAAAETATEDATAAPESQDAEKAPEASPENSEPEATASENSDAAPDSGDESAEAETPTVENDEIDLDDVNFMPTEGDAVTAEETPTTAETEEDETVMESEPDPVEATEEEDSEDAVSEEDGELAALADSMHVEEDETDTTDTETCSGEPEKPGSAIEVPGFLQ